MKRTNKCSLLCDKIVNIIWFIITKVANFPICFQKIDELLTIQMLFLYPFTASRGKFHVNNSSKKYFDILNISWDKDQVSKCGISSREREQCAALCKEIRHSCNRRIDRMGKVLASHWRPLHTALWDWSEWTRRRKKHVHILTPMEKPNMIEQMR